MGGHSKCVEWPSAEPSSQDLAIRAGDKYLLRHSWEEAGVDSYLHQAPAVQRRGDPEKSHRFVESFTHRLAIALYGVSQRFRTKWAI